MDLVINIPNGSFALGNGVLIPSAPKALVDGVLLPVFVVALPVGKRAGGSMSYFVEVTDGTHHHASRGQVEWICYNDAGTMDGDYSPLVPAQKESDGGSLAVDFAWDFSVPGQATFKVKAIDTLTPTLYQVTYKVFNDSQQEVVLS